MSDKKDEEIVPVSKREEYIATLLRDLHDHLCDYYKIFEEEEVDFSPCFSIVDIRKEAMRDEFLFLIQKTLFWNYFFNVKSMMHKK